MGDAYAPVDEIARERHRAAAVSIGIPPRLIAEQHTAAWVWGALSAPPRHHRFCVEVGARVRVPGVPWMSVREVVLTDADLATIGSLRLTTPLRTAVDLARFSADFGISEARVVRELLAIGQIDETQWRRHIESRRNLPNKRQAIERLSGCG